MGKCESLSLCRFASIHYYEWAVLLDLLSEQNRVNSGWKEVIFDIRELRQKSFDIDRRLQPHVFDEPRCMSFFRSHGRRFVCLSHLTICLASS